MIQAYLSNLHCNEETSELGADEPYLFVITVNLAATLDVEGFPVPLPAFEVVRYGPFEDVDKDETHFAPGIDQSFWGVNGASTSLVNPDDVIFIVALMENDELNPDTLRTLVKGAVGASLLGSLALERPDKVAALIRDVNSALASPIAASPLDDKVGDPQELRFSQEELVQAESGQIVSKSLVFAGDDGQYTLVFEARNPRPAQGGWMTCGKCKVLFFEPQGVDSDCPVGGNHQAEGLSFQLPHDIPPSDVHQSDWQTCHKCKGIFFNGDPISKGVCPAPVRAGHEAAGIVFQLPHSGVGDGTHQPEWRFCDKCRGLFFAPHNVDGDCPDGGHHVFHPQSFNFRLPHDIVPEPGAHQGGWMTCLKCKVLFFALQGGESDCPFGGRHEAVGIVFQLPHDFPEPGPHQSEWQTCHKCKGMFFNGDPLRKGVCPAPIRAGHEAAGIVFQLPHDMPGPGQDNWRFCDKCRGLFFEPHNVDGDCPDGGNHVHHPDSFNFRLDPI